MKAGIRQGVRNSSPTESHCPDNGWRPSTRVLPDLYSGCPRGTFAGFWSCRRLLCRMVGVGLGHPMWKLDLGQVGGWNLDVEAFRGDTGQNRVLCRSWSQ